MKIWPVEQNTEGWMQLRSCIPTASEMHRVVCPEMRTKYYCDTCGTLRETQRKTCACCGEKGFQEVRYVAPSSQQDGYIYQLLAASFGYKAERPPNADMDRGHDAEPRALAAYELITMNEVTRVGFCTTDDGMIGASPDGMVGTDGLVEAKSANGAVHMRHEVLDDLTDDHKVQVQAQMLVTGRKWVDVVSHCEDFPADFPGRRTIIMRAYRDEEFIAGMNDVLVDFITRYQTMRAELLAKWRQRAVAA